MTTKALAILALALSPMAPLFGQGTDLQGFRADNPAAQRFPINMALPGRTFPSVFLRQSFQSALEQNRQIGNLTSSPSAGPHLHGDVRTRGAWEMTEFAARSRTSLQMPQKRSTRLVRSRPCKGPYLSRRCK